jgi:hypothetical protein
MTNAEGRMTKTRVRGGESWEEADEKIASAFTNELTNLDDSLIRGQNGFNRRPGFIQLCQQMLRAAVAKPKPQEAA